MYVRINIYKSLDQYTQQHTYKHFVGLGTSQAVTHQQYPTYYYHDCNKQVNVQVGSMHVINF